MSSVKVGPKGQIVIPKGYVTCLVFFCKILFLDIRVLQYFLTVARGRNAVAQACGRNG